MEIEQIVSDTPIPNKFTAKILDSEEAESYWVVENFMQHSKDNKISKEELDNLAKVFDSIYEQEIIDSFPVELSDSSDIDYLNPSYKNCPSIMKTFMRQEYIKHAGYAIITKTFADNLAKYLSAFKCLEIMSGRGMLAKALRDRGVDIIATDDDSWDFHINQSPRWTEVEHIEAGDAIRKYNDVEYIIASWMPMDIKSKRIIRMIRKHNPYAKLIIIGEGFGGCTANDAFFDRIEPERPDVVFESFIADELPSWWAIHDYAQLAVVTKPWYKNYN